MIFLFIFLWMIAAVITCGILISINPDEWDVKDAWIGMLVCTLSWPLMAIFGLVYLIFTKFGKLAIAVAGFLDSFSRKIESSRSSEEILEELKAYLSKYDDNDGVKVKYILQILYGEEWYKEKWRKKNEDEKY